MRFWPLGAVAGLTAALLVFTPSSAGPLRPLALESAPVRFSANDPDETRVGQLIWRGTIRLTSNDADFGGLSGLIVSEDGARFHAVTDAAHWVSGTFSYARGRLAGAKGLTISPMLDSKGQEMTGKQGDAEGLDTLIPGEFDGPVAVSFEGMHRVWTYDAPKDGQRQWLREAAMPETARDMPGNGGFETLVALNPDRFLGMSEDAVNDTGQSRAWVFPLDPEDGAATEIAVARTGSFSVTDAKIGPDGMLYILERSFSRQTGVAVRISRAALGDLKPGSVIRGEELALMGMSFVIDNFEGIAVRKTPEGKTLIYLAADDNFAAPVQQTLIMMLEVRE